eukprot:7311035-Prymnesium_polylepis.1
MPKKKRGAKLTRHARGDEQKQGTTTKSKAETRDERAAAAAMTAMRAETRSQAVVPPVQEPETAVRPPPPKRRRGIDESRRRHAIHELYVNIGEPRPAKWRGHGGVVSEIRNALRLPAGADRCIEQ